MTRKEAMEKVRKEKLQKELLNDDGYQSMQGDLLAQIQNLDLSDVDFKAERPKSFTSVIEKSATYIWVRVFLKDEDPEIKPNDIIQMHHPDSGEKVNLTFMCYGKTDDTGSKDESVVNYNPEDDKKILCLMIDDNIIKTDNSLDFMKTLFPSLYWFVPQAMRLDELEFKNITSNKEYEYTFVLF